MYGFDLDPYIARKRLRALADLVFELPKASRTWEAVIQDPELARGIVASQVRDGRVTVEGEDLPDDEPGWRPQYRAWDLHAEQLGQVVTALGSLQQAVIASNGGKGRAPKPYPMPVTALPEVEREQAASDMAETLGMLGISFDGDAFARADED